MPSSPLAPKVGTRLAYSYCRFSTLEQAKGDSQRRQINAGKKWCRENGYDHSEETFFDKGKSGFSGETLEDGGELKRLLSLVENGTIRPGSVLLVENFDRLSRLKPVQSYTLFLNLITAGIGLVFTLSYDKRVISEELLNKEPGLLQMILGECIRAHTESARKSQLVSESKQEKRRRIAAGEILKHNAVPKYFSWDSAAKRYVRNEQADLVVRIVKEYLAGSSLYAIAARLNREGVKSIKARGKWAPRSVRSILGNKALIGEYLGNVAFFRPIISVEDFEKVQILLNQNANNKGKPADLVNIFKGVIYCRCGQRMNVCSQSVDYRTKRKWKKAYRYFRCATVSQGTPCYYKHVTPTTIIEVEFVVHCLMADPRQVTGDDAGEEQKAIRSEITGLQARIATLSASIRKLLTFKDGSIPMPEAELRESLSALEKQRNQANTLLDAANLRLLRAESTPSDHIAVRAIVESCSTDGGGDWDEPSSTYSLSPAEIEYDRLGWKVEALLADNVVRQKLRLLIPRLIKRIVINSRKRVFEVFDHSGRSIYRSMLSEPAND